MVYRGKPSAGCENCRKAKKRCGLEQPACERCVKLKKVCSGYRDTSALQIQDESEAVKRKAERQKAKPAPTQSPQQWVTESPQQQLVKARTKQNHRPTITHASSGIPTPGSTHSGSTSSSDSDVELDMDMLDAALSPSGFDFASYDPLVDDTTQWTAPLLTAVLPKPEDLATTYFYENFTAISHWDFLRKLAADGRMDPCLDLAIKACGMAALGNKEHLSASLDYARSMYTVSLGLLNSALRDPRKCKTDESLIAVAMLGRYENLMCENHQSIQTWRHHIKGATQLLKLRGLEQFRTPVGRALYREIRAQAITTAIWDDDYIPTFFRDYQDELETYPDPIGSVVDVLTRISWDFADLRANIRYRRISAAGAAVQAAELEQRFDLWAADTFASSERWRYYDMEVDDSEHIWDGKVHSYLALPAPTVWLTYRNMRIMLTRSQEWLCDRIQLSDAEREEKVQHYRLIRRQMTDDICATVPVALGHASPAYNSPCVMISAYHALWPLFFAGTCALERVGPAAARIISGAPLQPGATLNKAGAQAEWVLSRLEYISTHVGLKWADGIAAVMRGDFQVPAKMIYEDERRPYPQLTKVQKAKWLVGIERDQQSGRFITEAPGLLTEKISQNERKGLQPIYSERRYRDSEGVPAYRLP